MIRLVLFDIDGTLIHSGGAGVKAFAKAFATEFGIADGTQRLKFAGRTDVSLVREFFGQNQIPATPENFDRYFTAYLHWLEQIAPETPGNICPGFHEFYSALLARPEPPLIGLLTGNIERGAKIKLGQHGLWEKFPFGGFADDHEERDRIAVAAKQRGADKLKRPLSGDEVLVIGDTPLDIRCARAIQAKVLAVATGNFTVAELAEHKPDWALQDFTAITDLSALLQ